MTEREPLLHAYDRVPAELNGYQQWVNWRMDDEEKIPINAYTQGNAGVHWPNTWAPFEVVVNRATRYGFGVGFVLTEDDPYTCVDLDDCVGKEGQVSNETRAILDLLSGWVELSPSGTGLHIWVRNEHAVNRRMKGIEIYSRARWMTVTGRSNPQAIMSIPERTLELETLISRHFPNDTSTFDPPPVTLEDHEIWRRLFHSGNGAFFRSLFAGDTSVCYDDHSRAVIMLANQLAILTNLDAERVKRLLYQTGLVNHKWEALRGDITWLDYQIQDAISYVAGR